ncbi:MAG: fatty acid desaturase [Salinibacterium sp.]|nr:fatty acid desaturase [Salinibacterium sp.]
MIIGAWTFLRSDPVLWRTLGLLMCCAGSMGMAANVHSGAHRALSGARWLNRLFFALGFTVSGGLSMAHWDRTHNRMHHPNPNVNGKDSDHDFAPTFTMLAGDVDAASGWLRVYYERVQRWLSAPGQILSNPPSCRDDINHPIETRRDRVIDAIVPSIDSGRPAMMRMAAGCRGSRGLVVVH